jgi:hypothetical protein
MGVLNSTFMVNNFALSGIGGLERIRGPWDDYIYLVVHLKPR